MAMVLSLFFAFLMSLPWIAIGLMAALALRKRKDSKTLKLQAGGAAAMFVITMGQWLIVKLIMEGLKATPTFIDHVNVIFSFLLFLALVAFAIGYCAERFARRNPEKPNP